MESTESIDSPKNPAPRLKVVPPNQIKPTINPPAAQKLPIPAQLPTQPETTLPISNGGGSGGSGGSPTIKDTAKKIPHTLIMVGSIAAIIIGISMIEIDQKIKGTGAVEPNPSQDKTLSISTGNILEKLVESNNNYFSVNETIAFTTDPQQEERLRQIKQEITDSQESKEIAQKDFQVAISQLQQAEIVHQINLGRADRSRMNSSDAASIDVYRKDIATKQVSQRNLQEQLVARTNTLIKFRKLQSQGLIGSEDERLLEYEKEVQELQGSISILDTEIMQAQAREQQERERLENTAEDDIGIALEKNQALNVAQQEVDQARQKIQKLDKQIQQLQQEERTLIQDKDRFSSHKAPFGGIADLKQARQYLGQKLTEPLKIRVYNPDNMLVKVKIPQVDFCHIKPGMKVSFIPEGMPEMLGQVSFLDNNGEPDLIDPNKRLFAAWVNIERYKDSNLPLLKLQKDAQGSVTITTQVKQPIHRVVSGEIYKIFQPTRSVLNYCNAR